ncbi:MAG: hypothetical protein JW750_02875 [Anaerolineaceae bacterium]|nr:hypothetical protein [Anaerolineaceae bacterium]
MNLQEIIKDLELTVFTDEDDFSAISPESGYVCDLLSCVMAAAKPNSIWITIHTHLNVVAVAKQCGVAAVIITEGHIPDHATILRANEVGIPLLSTYHTSYYLVGKLWYLGIRSES